MRAEQGLVALVVGVGDQRHTRRDQLGAGGLDHHRVAAVVGPGERHPVVGTGTVAVLEFGLGHCGSKVHVPQHRSVSLVRLATGQVGEERPLGGGLGVAVNGGVGKGPVDAQAEGAPQGLERLFVLDGECLAQLHEVAAGEGHRGGVPLGLGAFGHRYGWGVPGVVGKRRVAGHPVVVLHPPFRGQAVVVPPHGVEDLAAPHALEAGNGVGVGVGKDVAHVQRPRRRGWWGVNGVDVAAVAGGIEPERSRLLPVAGPAFLEALEGWFGGYRPVPGGTGAGSRGVGGVGVVGQGRHRTFAG